MWRWAIRYAAGQGAAPYTDPACFVSRKGYPVIADNLRNVQLTTNAGCSGQVAADVAADALAAVDSGTEIVTVTVGGNDLGTTNVILACLPAPTPECGQRPGNSPNKAD